MAKHIALATIVTLALAATPAFAQQTSPRAGGTRLHHPLQRVLRSLHARVAHGVRQGSLTPDERAALRARFAAFREEVKTLRQSGTRLTREQRQSLRRQLQQISREIYRAKHN